MRKDRFSGAPPECRPSRSSTDYLRRMRSSLRNVCRIVRIIRMFKFIFRKFHRLHAALRKYFNLGVRRGRKGERAAVRFLRKENYKILDTNYQSGRYELDIVAEKNGCTVFVEVRGRQQSSLQSGYDSVDKTKKHALRCAIYAYLKKHHHIRYWRLDIIAVEWDENGKIVALRHYENVPSKSARNRSVY